MIVILTCKLKDKTINCIDGKYNKEQLKKWSSKDILKCPACGESYEYCHGLVKMPYFRHKDKVACIDKYAENETEEHLLGKRDLYGWIGRQECVSNVILEAWISETRQRPDIMFDYKGEKWVIEYQCSPIVTEYFERHDLYQAAGIHDIWICGSENYLKSNMRIKELEKYCVGYYDPNYQLFIYGDDNKLQTVAQKTSAGKRLHISIKHLKYHFTRCLIPISDMMFLDGQIVYKYISSPTKSISVLETRSAYKKYSNKTMYNYLYNKCANVEKYLRNMVAEDSICSIDIQPPKLFRDNQLCVQYCLSFSTPWGLENEHVHKRLPIADRDQYYARLLSSAKEILDLRKRYQTDIVSILHTIQKHRDVHLIVGFCTKQRRDIIQGSKPYTQYFKNQLSKNCFSNYEFIHALTTHISNHCSFGASACVVILPQDILINNHYISLHRYHEEVITQYLKLLGFNNVTVVHDRENIFEYIPQEDN